MGKLLRLILSYFILAFMMPFLALAQETSNPPSTSAPSATPQNQNYEASIGGFYWGTHVSTPNFTANPSSYGGQFDMRFLKGSELNGFGFGLEYTITPTGPRFVNTGGVCTNSFAGYAGYAVTTNAATGACGLVSPGSYGFGGGKLKYFLPMDETKNYGFAVYGDYFSSVGGRNAYGGGVEMDYHVNDSFRINAFADYNNVTGNGFPTQNLFRYQAAVYYQIPQTKVEVLAGWRGYNFYNFYNTSINGYILGAGAHF